MLNVETDICTNTLIHSRFLPPLKIWTSYLFVEENYKQPSHQKEEAFSLYDVKNSIISLSRSRVSFVVCF
jgi:hypothetical protein